MIRWNLFTGPHKVRPYSTVLVLLLLTVVAFAQSEEYQPNVEYKVTKMQKVLNLSDSQVAAIRPIVKDFMFKRHAVLEEIAGEGVIDHVAVKTTLNGLKETEYQKLSKVLNEDQMKKWIDKENLMAALNPDGGESIVDEGPSLTAEGANFKF